MRGAHRGTFCCKFSHKMYWQCNDSFVLSVLGCLAGGTCFYNHHSKCSQKQFLHSKCSFFKGRGSGFSRRRICPFVEITPNKRKVHTYLEDAHRSKDESSGNFEWISYSSHLAEYYNQIEFFSKSASIDWAFLFFNFYKKALPIFE